MVMDEARKSAMVTISHTSIEARNRQTVECDQINEFCVMAWRKIAHWQMNWRRDIGEASGQIIFC